MGQYGDAADMFAGGASTADGVRVESTAGGNALFAALPEEVSMRSHIECNCRLLKQHARKRCAALCAASGIGKRIHVH